MNAVYAPGTVAVISADFGEVGFTGERGLRIEHGWATAHGETVDRYVTDISPLVVIDPEDRAQVERLIAAIERAVGGTATARARDNMQAALRSLIAAPKPVEPETWGVVEASCVHNRDRREWVKHPDGNWWPVVPYSEMDRSIAPQPDDWSDLVDPVLIREGVTQ